jgi:hypothetical protein
MRRRTPHFVAIRNKVAEVVSPLCPTPIRLTSSGACSPVYADTTHIIPVDMGIPSSASPCLSGWGDALFILLALLSVFEPVFILLAVGHDGAFEEGGLLV